MEAYSENFRKRIVDAVERRGMEQSEATRTFDVSLSSVKRYVKTSRQGRSLSPGMAPGKRPKIDEPARKLLEEDLKERPFATLQQRCDYLRGVADLEVSRSVVCRTVKRMKLHQKKGTVSATERDEWARAAWRVTVAEVLEAERLVFVDEMGLHTSLAPLYGYAPKGERLRLSVPRNCGPNITLLSSMTIEGMGPSMVVEGSTTAKVFEAYLEHFLVPELKPGQVVVIDNLGAHKPRRVRELIEDEGRQLLYLPAYSPDYNPIEEAFSKIKGLLRKVGVRARETLVEEAIGRALYAVSSWDAQGFFKHAGYRLLGQLL